MRKRTEQEKMWAGKFGADYQKRNAGSNEANVDLFCKALDHVHGIRSMIEFGAGTGRNLGAISAIFPHLDATAVEINPEAAAAIPRCAPYWESIDVRECSMFDYEPTGAAFDLVLTKGLLIHIPPKDLPRAFAKIIQCAGRYILLAEYYAPTLTMIHYRGHKDRLWKGDYAGMLLRAYPKTLHLVDYGFQYHLDPNWPQDDVTWFLLEVI